MKTLSQHLLDVAVGEIGVREEGVNVGCRVNQYKACTTLNPEVPWYWCAAFVCWCVKEAVERWQNEHRKITTFAFDLPNTAAAYGFDEWSLARDDSTKTYRRHPGAPIGIFSLKSISHCGIAISLPDKNGWFFTVEGNTNSAGSRNGDGVYRKIRHIRDVRDFIEFKI